MTRTFAALAMVAAASCGGSGGGQGVPAGDGPLVGVYRASIDDGSGTVRHAKLWLWAERPDRLHAELVAAVGGVRFVLDAGGGMACVVDMSDATAYAGAAGPAAVEALVGVRVSIEDAVSALLTGSSPAGVSVDRRGAAAGGLPESFVIAEGSRVLELKRIRFERGSAAGEGLGTGRPPAGMSVRPMHELPAVADPARGEGDGG